MRLGGDYDDAGLWHQQSLIDQQQQEEMKMLARQKSAGATFEPLEAGVHPVVCDWIVDLGLQQPLNPQYKTVYKVLLGFQVPGELRDDGDPQRLFMTVTNSMHKKAVLRKLIENWFGKSFPSDAAAEGFDLKQLLGKVGYANVSHTERNEKTYANIAALMPLPKGMPAPELVGDTLYYSEAGDQPLAERSEAYKLLPEWVRNKIDTQVRAEDLKSDESVDDDIPF